MKRLLAALALSLTLNAFAQTPQGEHWSATWAGVPDSPGPALKAQTIRQVVRISVGGSKVRIRLSNLFGTEPVAIGPVHLALRAVGAAIQPATDRALTFGGKATVVIPAGASVLSDPLDITVPALQELAVSMYLPSGSAVSTIHGAGMQTAYMTNGDASAAESFTVGQTDDSRYFLTDVEVAQIADARTLVVLGDSITDGIGSGDDRNARWTDALSVRLQGTPALASVAVVNAGIAGNRILNNASKPFVGPSALSRFGRDVLDKPGVRWVLLHEGINDITASQLLNDAREQVSVEQIIAGMQALAARARANGVRIWAATLLPFEGTKRFYSEAAEARRQAINAWIRSSGAFDAVIDFDDIVRDPSHPQRLLPGYDSGDHLHPNAAGYKAMAEALDLRMFAADPGPAKRL